MYEGLQADSQGHRKRSTKAARSRAFHLGRTPAGRDPRQEAAGCPNVVWSSRPYKRLPTAPALDLSKDPGDTIHTRNKINPTPPAHNLQQPGQPTKPCGSDKTINTLRAPRFAPQQPYPLIANPPAPLAAPRISLSLSLSPQWFMTNIGRDSTFHLPSSPRSPQRRASPGAPHCAYAS